MRSMDRGKISSQADVSLVVPCFGRRMGMRHFAQDCRRHEHLAIERWQDFQLADEVQVVERSGVGDHEGHREPLRSNS